MKQLTIPLAITLICVFVSVAHADNAVSHCARVPNDDKIKNITADMLGGVRKHYAGDNELLLRSTVYRCMNGAVMICNAGANNICGKPNTVRHMKEVDKFCRENPNSEGVPYAVTGHSTIHVWKCANGRPQIVQTQELDSRGFTGDLWKRL